MNLKTLLWKEYRNSRLLLVAAAGLLLLPYAAVTIYGLSLSRFGEVYEGSWARHMEEASGYSLLLSLLLCSLMGGNAIAGERADRSAEFVGYLPISRISAIVVKAAFAVSICLLMLASNGCVAFLALEFQGITLDYSPGPAPVTLVWVAAILMFGVSWLVSATTNSSAIAAVLGLASAMILGMICSLVEEALGHKGEPSTRLFAAVFLSVGLGCFVAGVVCFLRRVEP